MVVSIELTDKIDYTKKPLTLAEQVARLKQRGLVFDDESEATAYLFNISYYRLRAYTYPFQENGEDSEHTFTRKDIHFKDIIDLYCFDRRLRSLIFNTIEKIEVAVRTKIVQVYAESTGDSHWFNDESLYRFGYDDLMDRTDVRRGKPTVHKVWNDNTAVLSGDAMLILAFRYMTGCPPEHLKEVMDLFSLTTLEICEGQQLDMEFESRCDVTEDEYIEMIRLKTAVLLAGSLKIGAILAGATAEDAENLYNFGMHIGVAFQLQDDLLDVYGDPEVFGKKIGGDILCNKKTYMLIKALNRADEKQHAELNRWLNAEAFQPSEKIEAVTEIYNQLNIRNICESKMREYYTFAMESLAAVAVAEDRKKELKNLVKLLMYREM